MNSCAACKPEVRPGSFVMVSTNSESGLDALASVDEEEGMSLVLEQHKADAFRLEYSSVFAWITLTVHSSLDAVGLTAAVANTLASAGIPCNVLAGFHHDHLLVPGTGWTMRWPPSRGCRPPCRRTTCRRPTLESRLRPGAVRP